VTVTSDVSSPPPQALVDNLADRHRLDPDVVFLLVNNGTNVSLVNSSFVVLTFQLSKYSDSNSYGVTPGAIFGAIFLALTTCLGITCFVYQIQCSRRRFFNIRKNERNNNKDDDNEFHAMKD